MFAPAHNRIVLYVIPFLLNYNRGASGYRNYIVNFGIHKINIELIKNSLDNHMDISWRFEHMGTGCKSVIGDTDFTSLGNKLVDSLTKADVTLVNISNNEEKSNEQEIALLRHRNEVKLRYIPYNIDQLQNIFSLKRTSVQDNGYRSDTVQHYLAIKCPKIGNREESNDTVNGHNRYTQTAFNVIAPVQILAAVSSDIKSSQVCTTTFTKELAAGYSVRRLWLGQCCSLSLTRDSSNVYRHRNGSSESEFVMKCHDPNATRHVILQAVQIMCFIMMFFSPLLIRFIPTKPWHKRYNSRKWCRHSAKKDMDLGSLDADGIVQVDTNRLKVVPEEELLFDDVYHNPQEPIDRSETNINLNRVELAIDNAYAHIYLDDEPEYDISFSMILYYACLFQIKSHTLTVVRRLVFVYLTFALTCYLFEVYRYSYSRFLPNTVIQWQVELLSGLWQRTSLSEDGKLAMRVFVTPIILTTGLFIFLFFFFIKRISICESLYWNDDGYFYGNSFGDVTPDLIEEKFKHREDGYEHLLYNIMKKRLLYLLNPRFWSFWWNDCVCKSQTFSKDPYVTKKQPKSTVVRRKSLTVIWYALKSIAYSLLLILYVIPAISVMTELLLNISHKQPPERRCLAILLFLLTLCGLVVIYATFYNLSVLGLQIVVFATIDAFRKLESTVHYMVVVGMVVFYITNTLSRLRESYIELKRLIFEVIRQRTDNSNQEIFFRLSHDTPILPGQRNGVRAIPTQVFDVVCDKVAPLNGALIENLLKLAGTIFIVIVTFLLVADYHIFCDLSPVLRGLSLLALLSVPAVRERLLYSHQQQLLLQLKRKILIDRMIKKFMCFHRKKPNSDHNHVTADHHRSVHDLNNAT